MQNTNAGSLLWALGQHPTVKETVDTINMIVDSSPRPFCTRGSDGAYAMDKAFSYEFWKMKETHRIPLKLGCVNHNNALQEVSMSRLMEEVQPTLRKFASLLKMCGSFPRLITGAAQEVSPRVDLHFEESLENIGNHRSLKNDLSETQKVEKCS